MGDEAITIGCFAPRHIYIYTYVCNNNPKALRYLLMYSRFCTVLLTVTELEQLAEIHPFLYVEYSILAPLQGIPVSGSRRFFVSNIMSAI